MTTAENYELLGKSAAHTQTARNDSTAEEFDAADELEVLEFEDSSRLNVQTWTVVNA